MHTILSIASVDAAIPKQLCIEKLAKKAMKPSKLLWHLQMKYPALRYNPVDCFER